MSSTRQLPLYTIDSFTDTPFTGNPAAVCLDETEEGLGEDLMQKIAAEMNISETAFVKRLDKEDTFNAGSRFGLRWFTPMNEVPLCGHATLASAAVLFLCLENSSPSITFESASGSLETFKKGPSLFALDFPLNSPEDVSDEAKYQGLSEAVSCGHEVVDVHFSTTTRKLLVRLADEVTRNDLESLKPDIKSLPSLEPTGTVKGVIVTTRAASTDKREDGEAYDFFSRYFAPWVGIPEDPATGSAHTVLAGYWASQLAKKSFLARQCSSRGGDLWLEVTGNNRVSIAGNVTIIIEGKISIPK